MASGTAAITLTEPKELTHNLLASGSPQDPMHNPLFKETGANMASSNCIWSSCAGRPTGSTVYRAFTAPQKTVCVIIRRLHHHYDGEAWATF